MDTMDTMDTIGKRIKALRKKAVFSQDKFAELCGATKGAVSQWENDITKPTLQNLLLLRDKLIQDSKIMVSLDWLLCGDLPYRSTHDTQQIEYFAASPISKYHSRQLVQRVCDLSEQINDAGLSKATGYLECLIAEYPAHKAKLA